MSCCSASARCCSEACASGSRAADDPEPVSDAKRAGVARLAEQRHRNRGELRAQVFAETLGLRIAAQRGGDAVAEQALQHEVERQQIRQREALDLELARFDEQRAQALDREEALEPDVGLAASSPRRRRWRCRPCRRSARRRRGRAELRASGRWARRGRARAARSGARSAAGRGGRRDLDRRVRRAPRGAAPRSPTPARASRRRRRPRARAASSS